MRARQKNCWDDDEVYGLGCCVAGWGDDCWRVKVWQGKLENWLEVLKLGGVGLLLMMYARGACGLVMSCDDDGWAGAASWAAGDF